MQQENRAYQTNSPVLDAANETIHDRSKTFLVCDPAHTDLILLEGIAEVICAGKGSIKACGDFGERSQLHPDAQTAHSAGQTKL